MKQSPNIKALLEPIITKDGVRATLWQLEKAKPQKGSKYTKPASLKAEEEAKKEIRSYNPFAAKEKEEAEILALLQRKKI